MSDISAHETDVRLGQMRDPWLPMVHEYVTHVTHLIMRVLGYKHLKVLWVKHYHRLCRAILLCMCKA